MTSKSDPSIVPLPENDRPYWLWRPHPFENYQTTNTLPKQCDVLIIGAGLMGTSVAYQLSKLASQQDLKIVMIEQGNPGCEASGRNAGHFELLPENTESIYSGFARERENFLRRCYPSISKEVLYIESQRQASVILDFGARNRKIFKENIFTEQIKCDYSPRGWLYLASCENEEQAICDDAIYAAKSGNYEVEIWSKKKIYDEFNYSSDFLGRFIKGDGTYHPFKYLCGLLKAAIRNGVQLYTHTQAKSISSENDNYQQIETNRGIIKAKQVVVATNAFTRFLLPELKRIQPVQGQISLTENVIDRCKGRVVTREAGPVYFHQPRGDARNGLAPLLMGGNPDWEVEDPFSRKRSYETHLALLALRKEYFPELDGRHFASVWVGTMGFTPDQLPAIGYLRPGVLIAMCCNGYGGSYIAAGGLAVAQIILEGKNPEWEPEEVFSPQRLLQKDPLFYNSNESYFRVGAALSTQLTLINKEIFEHLMIAHMATSQSDHTSRGEYVKGVEEPVSDSDLELLLTFASFKNFTREEVYEIRGLFKRIKFLSEGILFKQGDKGETCFIILEGSVHVSMQDFKRSELFITLSPGSIFGQQGFLRGKRTATCAIEKDTIILEVMQKPFFELLGSRSAIAKKILIVIIEDLIVALNGANMQLLELSYFNQKNQ